MIYEPAIITPNERYNLMCFGSIHDPGTIIHYPFPSSDSNGAPETIVLTWNGATQ